MTGRNRESVDDRERGAIRREPSRVGDFQEWRRISHAYLTESWVPARSARGGGRACRFERVRPDRRNPCSQNEHSGSVNLRGNPALNGVIRDDEAETFSELTFWNARPPARAFQRPDAFEPFNFLPSRGHLDPRAIFGATGPLARTTAAPTSRDHRIPLARACRRNGLIASWTHPPTPPPHCRPRPHPTRTPGGPASDPVPEDSYLHRLACPFTVAARRE